MPIRSLFSKMFNGRLFGWTLFNVPAKFEVSIALSVPEIIAGTLKLWAVPGYAVQGHPRSLILVPIESVYATS